MLRVLRVLRVRMELRVCVGVGVRVVVHRVLGWDGVERKIDKEGEEEKERKRKNMKLKQLSKLKKGTSRVYVSFTFFFAYQ